MALKVLKKTSRVIEVLGGSAATQRKLRALTDRGIQLEGLGPMPWRYFFRSANVKPFGYTVGRPMSA